MQQQSGPRHDIKTIDLPVLNALNRHTRSSNDYDRLALYRRFDFDDALFIQEHVGALLARHVNGLARLKAVSKDRITAKTNAHNHRITPNEVPVKAIVGT